MTPASFEELFPGKIPRESQVHIQELSEQLTCPAVILIEAPMGEGKTESAFQLADQLAAMAGQRGFYLGLPTQATSNQMFGRVCSFLEQRFRNDGPITTLLTHSHATLSPEFLTLLEKGRLFSELSAIGEEAEDGLIATSWFVRSKRGLLAPFAVGTVDQSLMSALITKRVFVRLFGLAGKVLIIDEVHAYDTYMSTLLDRLLEWLGALHSSVVLLSATLPAARRNALLESWARGAMADDSMAVAFAPYPRITTRTLTGKFCSSKLPTSSRSMRQLTVNRLAETSITSFLGQGLKDGGCAAIICNTVAKAQQLFALLERELDGFSRDADFPITLFHARFPFEERQQIEQAVFEAFGPSGNRPHRSVLVATQVVEQSLDLDFDLMISELAPIDLLLQRSGRLHRHSRFRPPGMKSPKISIIMPEMNEETGVPVFGRANSRVYHPYILLRTWLTLQNLDIIQTPQDIEALIEGVYYETIPELVTEQILKELRIQRASLIEDLNAARNEAANRFLPRPAADTPLWEFTANALEEDRPDLHDRLRAMTRLTDDSVQVVCLFGSPNSAFLDFAHRDGIEVCPDV